MYKGTPSEIRTVMWAGPNGVCSKGNTHTCTVHTSHIYYMSPAVIFTYNPHYFNSVGNWYRKG